MWHFHACLCLVVILFWQSPFVPPDCLMHFHELVGSLVKDCAGLCRGCHNEMGFPFFCGVGWGEVDLYQRLVGVTFLCVVEEVLSAYATAAAVRLAWLGFACVCAWCTGMMLL